MKDERIADIYGYFKERIQPGSRTFPEAKIASRLKTFSADELRLAIDHFAADWWYMKHCKSQGAKWFFHDDERIEKFVNMTPRAEPEPQQGGRAKGAVPLGKGDPALKRFG